MSTRPWGPGIVGGAVVTFGRVVEVRRATSEADRRAVFRFWYSVYVEEMGRFRGTADHVRRELRDPEDESSWIFVAIDGEMVVGACRFSMGGDGFSDRQIRHYSLHPFLETMPHSALTIGERMMVAQSHRGGSLRYELGSAAAQAVYETDVQIAFGAAEPHLIANYAERGQRPYAARNFFSEESGYLVPNFSLPKELAEHGVRREWKSGKAFRNLPPKIRELLGGTGAVRSASLTSEDEYWTELSAALETLPTVAASLFHGLDDAAVRRCTARSAMIDCAGDDQIIKRDGTARNMYLVLSGELEARDGDRRIRSLGPGDVFGESGFLLDRVRTADVFVTAAHTRILSLSDRSLRSLVTDAPNAAVSVFTNLARILSIRLGENGQLTG
jgi:Cyclic nucleotide-binding domain